MSLVHLRLMKNFRIKMTKTWCFGGRHFINTVNENVYENVHPRTKKLVKIIKGSCSICGRNISQIFSK